MNNPRLNARVAPSRSSFGGQYLGFQDYHSGACWLRKQVIVAACAGGQTYQSDHRGQPAAE